MVRPIFCIIWFGHANSLSLREFGVERDVGAMILMVILTYYILKFKKYKYKIR
jgi:hypothetical protein